MKDRSIAADYILRNFEPSDRLAVVVLNKRTGAVTQRISAAERIASRDFQAWLRHQNAQGQDIYLSMNALKPEADRRTKNDIRDIRHIYLDFDQDGEAAATRIIEDSDLPMPNYVVETSEDKRHVIWRVEGFTKEHLQQNLARQWGADPAATDCARVLRLPGFDNHKYGFLQRVRIEQSAGNPEGYRPEDFPDFPLGRLSPQARHRHAARSTLLGPPSQSERDWAFAKRALTRGESMDSVIAAIAEYRRGEKPDPGYDAAHTVRKAAAALAYERQHPAYEIVEGPER